MPSTETGVPPNDPRQRSRSLVVSEVLTRWTLIALIVAVPIAVMPGFTYDVFNVPKLGLLLIGISIALALYGFGRVTGATLPIPRAAWVVPLAMFVPLLVAWLFSPYREWALFGQYSRFQGLVPYGAFATFSVLSATTFRGRERTLAWALATAGGLVGAGLLAGMAGISPTGGASQAGTLGNSNYVGGFLAITLPVALHLWLTAQGRAYAAIVATTLTATGLILSYSQGGQAAALAGVALVVGSHVGSAWARRLSLVVAAAVAAVVLGLVAVNFVRPVGGYTASTRSNMWRTALAMGNESPLIGSGPNAFALEGPRYRSLQDSLNLAGHVGAFVPLGIEYQTSDDPHSVPLSFYANAGILGVAGIVAAWAWTIQRGLRLWSRDQAGVAFFAATVAYFVQALISIDEITLRLGFWAAVSGLIAVAVPSTKVSLDTYAEPSAPRRTLAATLALLIAVGGSWYGVRFIQADHEVRRGTLLFADRYQEGAATIRSALSFRDEALYREVLAGNLGLRALDLGRDGGALIEEMKDVNSYLDELPDVGAIHAHARIMSYWGHYDAAGYASALDLYERAGRLDPVNPLIKIETAEVFVDLGRTEAALDLLEPLAGPLAGRVPEYWAALAIVRSEAGRPRDARDALAQAVSLDPRDCRVRMAEAIARLENGTAPSGDAENAVLNLRLNCDPGLYNMFLRRLPTAVGSRYV